MSIYDDNKILQLLLSKSINHHYTKRYVKFIFWCKSKEKIGYVEKHHILPKAKTCFPEFSTFKYNEWNCVKLTPREHFIAHWLLWKALGNFMGYSFFAMKRKSKCQSKRYFKINSKIYSKLREDVAHNQSKRKISKDTINKMSISQKNKQKLTCPHCNKSGDLLNMKKYHFDNCKIKTGLIKHNIKQLSNIVACPHCNKSGKEQGMLATHFDNCKFKS